MTALPILNPPTNRELIDRAYQAGGFSDAMFGRTPEEYAAAIPVLGAMMNELYFNQLGYDDEEDPGKRVEQESGIARQWSETVAYCLAERILSLHGKTLSGDALNVKNRLYQNLVTSFALIPSMCLANNTPRGAGNRLRTPFFISDDD